MKHVAYLSAAAAVVGLLALVEPAQAASYKVKDSKDLLDKLKIVNPGDTIELAAGTYTDIVISRSGSKGKPITLTGPKTAVFSTKGGYGLHHKASYWKLTGFTVQASAKGIILDGANHNVIDGVAVADILQEAVHFRSFSSDNVIQNSSVNRTGYDAAKKKNASAKDMGYAEGIYVGSALSNWKTYSGGKPDKSDNNCIYNNTLTGITAEGIDIKEGTTGTLVIGNKWDAERLSGENYATRAAHVKGTNALFYNNTIVNITKSGKANPEFKSGLVTYKVAKSVDTSGSNNVFQKNTIDMNGADGFGIEIDDETTGNKVCSDNVVKNAKTSSGYSNVTTVSCPAPKATTCANVLSN